MPAKKNANAKTKNGKVPAGGNGATLDFESQVWAAQEDAIVHELLHFNATNHGKLCKSLMLAYLGDYEKIEKKIKIRYGKTTKRRELKPIAKSGRFIQGHSV